MEPADAQKLAEARAYVHEYERMIADLERSEREQQEIRSDNEAI